MVLIERLWRSGIEVSLLRLNLDREGGVRQKSPVFLRAASIVVTAIVLSATTWGQNAPRMGDCARWNEQFSETFMGGIYLLLFLIPSVWVFSCLLGRWFWPFTHRSGRVWLTLSFILSSLVLLWGLPYLQTIPSVRDSWFGRMGFNFPYHTIPLEYVYCIGKPFHTPGLFLNIAKGRAALGLPWDLLLLLGSCYALGWIIGVALQSLLARTVGHLTALRKFAGI